MSTLKVALLCLVSVLIAWLYPLVGTAIAVLGCCLAVGMWFRRDGRSAASRRASVTYAAVSIAVLGFASRDTIRKPAHILDRSHQSASGRGVQQTFEVTAY